MVSHTEPDHSFLVPAVLDLFPDAVVVGSKVCLAFLKNLSHRYGVFVCFVCVVLFCCCW